MNTKRIIRVYSNWLLTKDNSFWMFMFQITILLLGIYLAGGKWVASESGIDKSLLIAFRVAAILHLTLTALLTTIVSMGAFQRRYLAPGCFMGKGTLVYPEIGYAGAFVLPISMLAFMVILIMKMI